MSPCRPSEAWLRGISIRFIEVTALLLWVHLQSYKITPKCIVHLIINITWSQTALKDNTFNEGEVDFV